MDESEFINIDRGIHELRAGRKIIVDDIAVFHPEFIARKKFDEIKPTAKLVITKYRAEAITKESFSDNVEIDLADLSFNELQFLIAGSVVSKDLQLTANNNDSINAAIELVRNAELLPSIIYTKGILEINDIRMKTATITKYFSQNCESYLTQVTDAPLNLCDAEKAKIIGFRSGNGLDEHYAIVIGEPNLSEPLVRIHSSCYTGDLLGSLSCDCGDQLRGAIKLMNESGGGIIIYLMQEGRGIGLINKLRAYKLQADLKLDTVQANEFLGFDDEERSFGAAAAILKLLKIGKIRLVTNNPKKIAGLEALGIVVSDRIPLVITHQHNKTYLQIKSEKSGHIIN